MMVATRLGTDTMSLLAEFINWPWADSIDLSANFAYQGTGKCGAISY